MTIMEAIHAIDSLKPNSYSESDKIRWLSTLDGLIKIEIIDTHEDSEGITFNGYNDKTPTDTQLIAPAPYDKVYVQWLQSQIDYANEETAKYNNSSAAYNHSYSEFQDYYNRTHMPKSLKRKFF
ncbi:MAG: hypothetical protein J6V06_00525 [Clostridia bacterium]|nr:hypothetical protein [Clostridia bacterium]